MAAGAAAAGFAVGAVAGAAAGATGPGLYRGRDAAGGGHPRPLGGGIRGPWYQYHAQFLQIQEKGVQQHIATPARHFQPKGLALGVAQHAVSIMPTSFGQ